MAKRAAKSNNKKSNAGRKSKFDKKYIPIAKVLCSEFGADNKKLAKAFSVSTTTISAWKKECPEFMTAIKEGKDDFDTNVVEASLLYRATGYEYEEKEFRAGKLHKKTIKQLAPDVTAQIFWLKNRNPQRWRDRQDINHTLPDGCGVLVAPAKLDKDQWQKKAGKNQSTKH